MWDGGHGLIILNMLAHTLNLTEKVSLDCALLWVFFFLGEQQFLGWISNGPGGIFLHELPFSLWVSAITLTKHENC